MKKLVLLSLFILVSTTISSQITANQVDDFENGTVQSWQEGGFTISPNPPTNISTGGPDGINDNYLQNVSSGGTGAGSRMVMYNTSQWTGNFNSQGIVAIKCFAKAITNNLNLRIAFDGDGGQICTSDAILITAGNSWEEFIIPISASDFTLLAGGTSINNTLQNVTAMRILSSSVPSWRGDSVEATLQIDNIEALTTLSTRITNIISFGIYPNPTTKYIRLKNPNMLDIQSIQVTDILGKQIVDYALIDAAIDVSNLLKGMYFLRINTDKNYDIIPFIKL
ncbi:T9SS type A sorting domain-containing protein [Aestuariivivens sediminicola]|uniref:T9SS type A sorting domain-containing protein n=1 Tax=Aestuariivivens sediminicola TaxID=2913560 RepID=UPI001F55F394|nr:T9SS type A sorting domain-containing protein [Aestuariivivens sediminicola]